MRETALTLTALTETALRQRLERMVDSGPPLRGLGMAGFQIYGSTLYVGGVRPRPGRAGELVTRVLRFARDRWLHVSWIHSEARDDPAVPMILINAGFGVRERLRLMGCIGQLQIVLPHRPDLIVAPVATREQMDQYERISQWGFNDNPMPAAQQVVLRRQERWDEQINHLYQYYMGWLEGRPVSGAYVSLWERVPTIYGVVTAPSARRTGAASQVMLHLVGDILARGFAWTCLYVAVGNPAQQLYERLGYVPLLEQTTYSWQGSMF